MKQLLSAKSTQVGLIQIPTWCQVPQTTLASHQMLSVRNFGHTFRPSKCSPCETEERFQLSPRTALGLAMFQSLHRDGCSSWRRGSSWVFLRFHASSEPNKQNPLLPCRPRNAMQVHLLDQHRPTQGRAPKPKAAPRVTPPAWQSQVICQVLITFPGVMTARSDLRRSMIHPIPDLPKVSILI